MFVEKVLSNNSSKQNLKAEFVSFGQIQRNDRNILLELTRDNGAIIDIRKRQISQVLDEIAKNGDSKDISLLFSVAENLKFGYGDNSPMANFLNNDSSIAKQSSKQNTEWAKLIQQTLDASIQKNKSAQKNDFLKQFDKLYNAPADATKANANISGNQIFQQQSKAIKFRNKILNTDAFKIAPEGLNPKELEDFAINQQRIKRNLDYFLASSECALSEKVKVLSNLSKMMSPEYEINEQLKSKKTQVLSEILNDIVVKTPEQDVPNAKAINQKSHGMCAAISKVRKAAAYEDKLKYVEAVMSELDNKPIMNVFDITNLSKKIPVNKTDIDFDSLMKSGYRIVDASTLQWMHISGTAGDGSIQLERYIPFDKLNYGMFNDSKLYNDLPEEYVAEHNNLRVLAKTKESVEEFEKFNKELKTRNENARHSFNENSEMYTKYSNAIKKVLSENLPNKTDNEINSFVKKFLNNDKLAGTEFYIHPKESHFQKTQKLSNLINKELGNVDKKVTDKMLELYRGISDVKSALNQGKNTSLPYKAAYYENLFQVGARYRVSKEYALDVPEILDAHKKKYGIPSENALLKSHLEDLASGKIVNKNINPKMIKKLSEEININSPAQTDYLLEIIGYGNRKKYITDLVLNTLDELKNGGKDFNVDFYAKSFNLPADKKVIEQKFQTIMKELEKPMTEKKLVEISEFFNFNNSLSFVDAVLRDTFADPLSQKEIDVISKLWNVEPDIEAINKKAHEFYNEAEKLSEKNIKIAEFIEAPTVKQMVLKKMEQDGTILSRTNLDRLQAKFDSIRKYRMDVENFLNTGGEKPSSKGIYIFNKEDLNDLKNIKKSFSRIRHDVIRSYSESNNAISEPIKELYAKIGLQKGTMWVHDEGTSGLYAGEQVRVSEQFSGQPHYINKDVMSSVNEIKKSGKSGVCGSNVSYDNYSGHAQYIADIKDMPVSNPITGKISNEEILFYDNSWGTAENGKSLSKKTQTAWNDIAGYTRTDYGNKSGGPRGFIVSKNLTTGIPVKNIANDLGCTADGEKFAIFNDTILEGHDPKIVKRYTDVIQNALSLGENQALITLNKNLKPNSNVKLDMHKLENIEEFSETAFDNMLKFINGNGTILSEESIKKLSDEQKMKLTGISSKELYDKIPETHQLKILLRKIGLEKTPYGSFFSDKISYATTHQELDSIEDEIFKQNKTSLKVMIKDYKKPLDKIHTVKDLKESLGNSGLLINWIDKKFAPKTDEELIAKFKELKGLSSQSLGAVVRNTTREEIGIKPFDGYNFIEAIRRNSENAEKYLNNAIFKEITAQKFDLFKEKSPTQALNAAYRSLYVRLSHLETKYIKEAEDTAFKKYSVRLAFPNIAIASDAEVKDVAKQTTDMIIDFSDKIRNLKNIEQIKKISKNLLQVFSKNNDSKNLKETILPELRKIADLYPADDTQVKEILAQMSEASNTKFDINAIKQMVTNLYKQNTNSEINKALTQTLKSEMLSLVLTAKTVVLPAHQNEFLQQCKKVISLITMDANIKDPKTIENIEKLETFVTEKSFYKKPVEILHALVNELTVPNKNKIIHSNTVNTLNDTMNKALVSADLTTLEFDLMKNISDGNIEKFKSMMKDDYLIVRKTLKSNANKAKEIETSVLSPNGLKSVLFSMLDSTNDNRTLKLFVNSLGLNEKATNLLMSLSKPQKSCEDALKIFNKIQNNVQDINSITQIVQNFINKGIKETNAKATQSLLANIDCALPQTSDKKSTLVSLYKKVFKEQAKSLTNSGLIPEEIIMSSHEAAGQKALEYIQSLSNNIKAIATDHKEVKSIMDAISVKDYSKIFAKSENFKIELTKAIEYTEKILSRLSHAV